jgi:hypothetical protein
LIHKKRVLILNFFQIVGHLKEIMWLEEYAEKLAHFFEFLLPQAKLSRGITRDLVGERSILFPLLSGNVLRLVLLSAKRCGIFLVLKACTWLSSRKEIGQEYQTSLLSIYQSFMVTYRSSLFMGGRGCA